MTYLVWPRRNRFAWLPVGVDSNYIIAASAKVIQPSDLWRMASPPQVGQAVLAPSPLSSALTQATVSVMAGSPVPSADAYMPKGAVTVSIASPGVLTLASHGFVANQVVILTTTGALPTGLTAQTKYFVRNPTATTFELSAVSGGASISTSGSQSGAHTVWNKL